MMGQKEEIFFINNKTVDEMGRDRIVTIKKDIKKPPAAEPPQRSRGRQVEKTPEELLEEELKRNLGFSQFRFVLCFRF